MDDETGRSASIEILERVAAAEGIGVHELDPLYDAIDQESLDTLCAHGFDGSFTFEYLGYEITITGADEVSVQPAK